MATFVILFWPVVSIVLFSALGRVHGLIWSVVLGYLFLPERWYFDFPVLPPFGKSETISFGILLGVLATRQKAEPLPKADPWAKGFMTALLALLCLTPFVTMLTNRDGYMAGPTWIPPLGLWDTSGSIFSLFVILVPFFFARRFLHSPETHRELLKAMVVMGLFYSLLALYEIRMSPQLNNMVYGYFSHSWIQHIRGGGYRPLVFLPHGLSLGIFLFTVVLAAAGLVRASSGESRALLVPAMLFLFGMLMISRNLGALAICALLLPVALMMTPRMHLRIAVIVAVLFVTYPLVRNAYVVPLLSAAEVVSAERYRSLQFRFNMEDILLDRAAERPLAGWGTWGRNHVHDEVTGNLLTTADGLWIIQLGVWGWLGFAGFFGLIIAPLLLMRRALRHVPLTSVTSVMVLIVAGSLINVIPNSNLSPIVWLVFGALAGYVQFAPGRVGISSGDKPDSTAEGRRQPRYTRFGPTNRPGPVRLSRFN